MRGHPPLRGSDSCSFRGQPLPRLVTPLPEGACDGHARRRCNRQETQAMLTTPVRLFVLFRPAHGCQVLQACSWPDVMLPAGGHRGAQEDGRGCGREHDVRQRRGARCAPISAGALPRARRCTHACMHGACLAWLCFWHALGVLTRMSAVAPLPCCCTALGIRDHSCACMRAWADVPSEQHAGLVHPCCAALVPRD